MCEVYHMAEFFLNTVQIGLGYTESRMHLCFSFQTQKVRSQSSSKCDFDLQKVCCYDPLLNNHPLFPCSGMTQED